MVVNIEKWVSMCYSQSKCMYVGAIKSEAKNESKWERLRVRDQVGLFSVDVST